MEYSRKNMNWPPESFHPNANSDTICIHSISLHSSNRVLLCLNWVGRWARWWSVQKTERNQVSYLVKLKLMLFQYSGHLMQRADSLEKTLMLGKIEGKRSRGRQRMRWSDDITDSMGMSLSKLWEIWRTGEPEVLQLGVTKSQTQLSDWIATPIVAHRLINYISKLMVSQEESYESKMTNQNKPSWW